MLFALIFKAYINLGEIYFVSCGPANVINLQQYSRVAFTLIKRRIVL